MKDLGKRTAGMSCRIAYSQSAFITSEPLTKIKQRKGTASNTTQKSIRKYGEWALCGLCFFFGFVCAALAFNRPEQTGAQQTEAPAPRPSPQVVQRLDYSQIDACRNVHALLSLPDKELEKVDVLELNLAVAREIDGYESLDYAKYRKILDEWTEQFTHWYPTVEYAFYENPDHYENDLHFFRLGMLARSVFPEYRRLYTLSVVPFLWRGEQIFKVREQGHPVSIAQYISGGIQPPQRQPRHTSLNPSNGPDSMYFQGRPIRIGDNVIGTPAPPVSKTLPRTLDRSLYHENP